MIVTAESIQRAREILKNIEDLQAELGGLFGNAGLAVAARRRGRPAGAGARAATAAASGGGRRQMSAEGRARIAAAAKARWAKFRAEKKAAAKGKN